MFRAANQNFPEDCTRLGRLIGLFQRLFRRKPVSDQGRRFGLAISQTTTFRSARKRRPF